MQSPKRYLAMEDWMLVASEEATEGSVMAKQERIWPLSSGSNHCLCCDGLPYRASTSMFPANFHTV